MVPGTAPTRGQRSVARRALLGLGLLTVLGASTQAHAYCREVTEAAPSGYNPTDAGCFTTDPEAGDTLPPLFWRNQCVNFNLNRAASAQITLSEAKMIAATAFTQWSAAACPTGGSPSILATEGPDVDCDGQSEGHNNPIIFRDTGWTHTDAANALGYTTLTVDLDTGEILGAEIEINTENNRIVATTPPPAGAYDLPSILTHEAGHFLGLAHSQDPNAVMYAFYHVGSTTLQPDDLSGICAIYPGDGTRSTANGSIAAESCNPAPPQGFEDDCGEIDASVVASADVSTSSNGDSLWGCRVALGKGGSPAKTMPMMVAVGLALGLRRRGFRTAARSAGEGTTNRGARARDRR